MTNVHIPWDSIGEKRGFLEKRDWSSGGGGGGWGAERGEPLHFRARCKLGRGYNFSIGGVISGLTLEKIPNKVKGRRGLLCT